MILPQFVVLKDFLCLVCYIRFYNFLISSSILYVY